MTSAYVALHHTSEDARILSVHRTSEGAVKAIEAHKAAVREEWERMRERGYGIASWDALQAWTVETCDVRD